MKTNIKQFLVQKYYEYWLKENPKLAEDIEDLCHRVVMFNALYGTNFSITTDDEN